MKNDEKDILNRYTDLCIRKKDRGRELRKKIERRPLGDRYPEINTSDVLIEDEKTMEDMLKLYMEKSNILNEFIRGVENYMNQENMMSDIMKSIISELKCGC